MKTSPNSKFYLTVALCIFAFQSAFAQVPKITSFSPLSGTAGSTVVIYGNNFNSTPANNVVYFGATKATVNAASSTTTVLSVTVPTEATHSTITVIDQSTGLVASSNQTFTPAYTPGKTTIGASDFTGPTTFSYAADANDPNGNGAYMHGVTNGDIDGDGKVDLVLANRGASAISVLRNTTSTPGTITFATKKDFACVYAEPYTVVLVDLDGDGKLDAVSAAGNLNGTGFNFLRNTSTPGTVSFAAAIGMTLPFSSSPLVAGDVDGDGKNDLVITYGDKVGIYRNTSTGIGNISFAVPFYTGDGSQNNYVAGRHSLFDVNGDGKLDIVTGNNTTMVVFLNGSSGAGNINFPSQGEPFSVPTNNNVAVTGKGDFNMDGKMDIATISTYNSANTSLSVFQNTSTVNSLSFTRTDYLSTDNADITVADFNGDGKPDIALSTLTMNTYNKAISVYLNTSTAGGTISFAAKQDFGNVNEFSPYYNTSCDLDNDGKPEVILSNPNSYSIFRNTPTITANVNLSNLTSTAGILSPVFSSSTAGYTINVSNVTTSTTVTPTVADATSTLAVRVNNGTYAAITSGSPSSALNLNVGANPIDIRVTSQDGTTLQTYTILAVRQGNVLPVVLTSFTAKADGNRSKLEWKTNAEKDNDSFEIDRSVDGVSFRSLTSVKGNGTTTVEKNYLAYDNSPASGTNYYRLTQVDRDGAKTLLDIKVVSFKITVASVITYPNPSTGTINLSLSNFHEKQAKIALIDITGRVVHQETISVNNELINHQLNLKTKPAAGQYVLQVVGNNFKESIKVSIL